MKKHILSLIAVLLISALFILPVAADASGTPAAPEVTASNVASTGKIRITWNEVSGADYYEIYRSTAKDGTFTLRTTAVSTSYTNNTAKVGETYYYYVVAVASDGTRSAASNIVGRTCDLAQPVVTLSNIASNGKIKVSWDAVEGAVKYQVYRSTDNATWTRLTTTTSTTVSNTRNTEAGTQYYYRVRALSSNSSAHSAYSAVKSRTCDLPQPVVTLSNIASNGKINISWEAVEGAAKYQVYRSTDKETWTRLTTTTSTSVNNTKNTEAGTRYYYRVRALSSNTAAHSAYSAVKSRLCDCAQPVLVRGVTSNSSIQISWSEVSGAAGYTVYRSTSKEGTYKKLNTTAALAYTDDTVSAGKTYYYKVIANSSVSGASSSASAALTAKAVISAPTMKTTASATKTSIKISWNEMSGADGYYVYRRASASDSWTRIATVTSGTSYTDTAASGGQYYCVAGYTTVSGTKYAGYKSEAIRCRTLAPTTVTAVSHVFDHDITWTKVTGATGYQIYRKSDSNSTWTRLATLGKETSYYDADVDYTDHYYYRVRPIYKYNGVTTCGAYSSAEARYVGSCNDDYYTRCYAVFGEYVDDPRLYYSSSAAADADMVTVSFKVWDYTDSSRTTKTTKTRTLRVHKNLAYTVELMFAEIYACEEKYPISDLGGFIYKYRSEHSSGLAFDINVDANPYVGPDGVLVGTAFDPENNPYSIPVGGEVEEIFYKYGFIRGIYWANGYLDYMHFSFFGT